MQQSFTLLCPLSLSCWRKAFPESHNSRMEPTLPSLPLPLETDGLESAREEALDFISFVARNYPPDATNNTSFMGAFMEFFGERRVLLSVQLLALLKPE